MALQVAALGAVVVVGVRQHHLFTGFVATMAGLALPWVGLAFASELASIVPLAAAQRIVLRAGGANASLWRVTLVTFASNAITMSVPGGLAVAEGYTYSRYRQLGASAAVAAWAELASGALAFSALAGLSLAGALVVGGSAEPILIPTLAVVFVGALGAAVIFRHPSLLVAAIDWVESHLGRHLGSFLSGIARRARDDAHELIGVHPPVAAWVVAFGLSEVNWLLDAGSLALAFRAVGGAIPWGGVLLAFAGSKVIASIGITPGGLGIVEGGLVATFVGYGTPGRVAVAAVLVYRALTLIGVVGIGWAVVGLVAVKTRRNEDVG